MKARCKLFGFSAALGVACLLGCGEPNRSSETVAEGIILSVEYQMGGGRTEVGTPEHPSKTKGGQTGGFTRLNTSKAVPGGNGSWNVDAYGRLTREFLIITRPQRKDLGPQLIPVHRLVNVQFGDGGINQVNENQPKPD
jgi:hypothetical protein